MRIAGLSSLLAALGVGFAACGGAGTGGVGSTSSALTYYKDVKPVLDSKCVTCHTPGGIAPFSLETFADVQAHKDTIAVEVGNGTMPPWPPAKDCNTFSGDRSLSDGQKTMITGWIANGLKEGATADAPKTAAAAPIGISRVDLTLAMKNPYTPTLIPDDYRCFVADWPATTTKYVTGFRAKPGTAAIVHHVIAYLIPPDKAQGIVDKDTAAPGDGYPCFGGPGDATVNWLGVWAPGSFGSNFPTGTGIKVDPGSKVVIQVHYNTAYTAPEPDQTSIEVSWEDAVEKQGILQPYTNPAWISQKTMDIPAGAKDTMHTFAVDPTPYMSLITGGVMDDNKPFTIYNSLLHMHTHGTHARLEVVHAAGDTQCLLDIPAWNFHWQDEYFFDQPTTFNPGDQLQITCHWDNSPANQPTIMGQKLPPADLNWGESTSDEMCLGGIYITH